ncbi:hypothetical protein JTE90_013584 [Oedothorax gibbosus]|uniref:Uncharacterized protein n=1 Tax=Oedothorax gibbosus TaxID=931172 RepID=A0AAV6VGL5_9ARAC|nr:hypothetical protein JTE90_013584 [Oedothorax gibbosus]
MLASQPVCPMSILKPIQFSSVKLKTFYCCDQFHLLGAPVRRRKQHYGNDRVCHTGKPTLPSQKVQGSMPYTRGALLEIDSFFLD